MMAPSKFKSHLYLLLILLPHRKSRLFSSRLSLFASMELLYIIFEVLSLLISTPISLVPVQY